VLRHPVRIVPLHLFLSCAYNIPHLSRLSRWHSVLLGHRFHPPNLQPVLNNISPYVSLQPPALYGELGRGNVSSAFQSPAAIPCTPPLLVVSPHSLQGWGLASNTLCVQATTFAQGSFTVPNKGYGPVPVGHSVCGLLDVPAPSPSPSPSLSPSPSPSLSASPSPSPSAVPIPQAPFVKPVFDDVIPQVKLLPVGPSLFALRRCFLRRFRFFG